MTQPPYPPQPQRPENAGPAQRAMPAFTAQQVPQHPGQPQPTAHQPQPTGHQPHYPFDSSRPPKKKRSRFEKNFTVLLTVLLGLASIVTAWASFQASLYDGEMAEANTRAGVLAAEAESLYLEANAQLITDASLLNRIAELSVQMDYGDYDTSVIASATLDLLMYQSATEALAAAIIWSDEQNSASPGTYTHPQTSPDYLAALYTPYTEKKAQAEAAAAEAAEYNDWGDQLTLATVMLAICLFLYGIAAVLRALPTRIVLTGIATVVMLVASGLSLAVVATAS